MFAFFFFVWERGEDETKMFFIKKSLILLDIIWGGEAFFLKWWMKSLSLSCWVEVIRVLFEDLGEWSPSSWLRPT